MRYLRKFVDSSTYRAYLANNDLWRPFIAYVVNQHNEVIQDGVDVNISVDDWYSGTSPAVDQDVYRYMDLAPLYIPPVAITELIYTGSPQYLTTTGFASHGTIYYSMDETNWSTTRMTGTAAGTYTSYWKLDGEPGYESVSSTPIATTIAKANRTVSFSNPTTSVDEGSTVTNVAIVSAGASDGTLTYSSSNTNYATVNSSGVVTGVAAGSVTITASITSGVNYNDASASYSLTVQSTFVSLDFSYTGTVQECTLPAGTYKLQCWGALGGSNAAASSYSITAKSGGKGGYSEGVLTLLQPTALRVYVGGQGSSSAGGYNGGGSTTGSSAYSSGNENGVSRMGGGGGATDIRLSDDSLYSRMIVAGGGSGGAMCYRSMTTSSTTTTSIPDSAFIDGVWVQQDGSVVSNLYRASTDYYSLLTGDVIGKYDGTDAYAMAILFDANKNSRGSTPWPYTTVSQDKYVRFVRYASSDYPTMGKTAAVPYIQRTTSSTSTSNDSQVGYVGGGTTGNGYSDAYKGKQNTAGTNGSFGLGANQTVTNYRYCSGAGGGGWYGGGGGSYSDSSMTNCKCSGGGSGWVNIAVNASYRPSGYTGLQLDSGTTYAGSSSFPNTAGTGNETGHSGNGYAKITRLIIYTATLRFKDDENNPLEGESVTISNSEYNYSLTTDSNGEATSIVVSGTYAVSCDGYTLDVTSINVNDNQTFDFTATGIPFEFSYTGEVQTKTLKPGTYKIECWGALGGSYNTTYYGGKGGYSVGELTVGEQTTLYIMVGGQGTGGTTTGAKAGGYNGGGGGYSTSATYIECGGGGASDVRIDQNSLYARVIVAGGGGGAGSYSSSSRYAGGAGGGTSGQTPSQYSTSYRAGTGGTQTAAGTSYYGSTANSTSYGSVATFGAGAGYTSTSYQITGGGGGWYGGGYSRRGAGGGGSGYVYNSSTASSYPSGCLLNSSHYLANSQTIAGNASMPSTSGSTETGHEGNGFIKITKL